MKKEKLNEDYYSMDENEKFAMRYGAEGRHLSDVIRDSPGEISSPDKMLDAWDKGMNMRKDGSSKVFLDDIEKTERDNLLASLSHKADENGITAEPVRDMWGNDLSESSSFGNSENSSIPSKKLKLDFIEDENRTYTEDNYLLQPQEKYDKMYVTNYSNDATSGKTKDGKTYVTYGCEDKNVVGGIQMRLNEMNYKGKDGKDIGITGTFDEDTEEGIKQFQEDRGLAVTGILDDATKKEMGFTEDYSIKRYGKNATPWHQPYSRPFNLEEYNEWLEDIEKEKEKNIKDREYYESLNAWDRFWKPLLGAIFLCPQGVAQGTDMTYRGELQEAEEDVLGTNHYQDSGREYYYNSMGDKYKR